MIGQVLPGLVLGSAFPFLFSTLTMLTITAVSKNVLHYVSTHVDGASIDVLKVCFLL